MKTPLDPRHQKRIRAVKALFSWSYFPKGLKNRLAIAVVKHLKKINKIIEKSASEWPLKQINRIDLAILRLSIYELVIEPKQPPKVIIDEAIEMAKTYGSEKSPKFINGVLGTVLKNVNSNS